MAKDDFDDLTGSKNFLAGRHIGDGTVHHSTDATIHKPESGLEIERKWLIDAKVWSEIRDVCRSTPVDILQLYLAEGLRIRLKDEQGKEKAEMTYKRPAEASAGVIARRETTTAISVEMARELIAFNSGPKLSKTRFSIETTGGFCYEVDVYNDDLEGLIVVEVEFPSALDAARFRAPSWFGREVSGDSRYLNEELAKTHEIPMARPTPPPRADDDDDIPF